jgi:hypothetical protein
MSPQNGHFLFITLKVQFSHYIIKNPQPIKGLPPIFALTDCTTFRQTQTRAPVPLRGVKAKDITFR